MIFNTFSEKISGRSVRTPALIGRGLREAAGRRPGASEALLFKNIEAKAGCDGLAEVHPLFTALRIG